MSELTFEEFESYAREYAAVPVFRKIIADIFTPVSAYMRLAQDRAPAVLLESVEGGKQYARYSYLCIQPRQVVILRDGKTTLREGDKEREVREPLLDVLRSLLNQYQPLPQVAGIPSFCGGLVGYLGYETVTLVEKIPVYPSSSEDIPDAIFMVFDTIMAFDHLKQEVVICHIRRVDPETPAKEQFEASIAILDEVAQDLHTDIEYQPSARNGSGRLRTNLSRDQFLESVVQAKAHIAAGDVFQVVLSQRFQRETRAEPLTLYRALRNINPSPYMFCYQMEDFAIIGASPELLVKVEDGRMYVRPIAGTRPRGGDPQEDARLAEELLADEKERAEHLMLVDLGRNDVGRVCRLKSVEVLEFMAVEKYSHVMHLVSLVQGTLGEGKDALDALLAGFPAGTVTGAPKIRAMELIHQLEPDRRGIYSGMLGYMDFHGNLNTCIAIRTLLLKGTVASFQSGAGIVFDSSPEKEYEETMNKARAIMQAVEFAERGLR